MTNGNTTSALRLYTFSIPSCGSVQRLQQPFCEQICRLRGYSSEFRRAEAPEGSFTVIAAGAKRFRPRLELLGNLQPHPVAPATLMTMMTIFSSIRVSDSVIPLDGELGIRGGEGTCRDLNETDLARSIRPVARASPRREPDDS